MTINERFAASKSENNRQNELNEVYSQVNRSIHEQLIAQNSIPDKPNASTDTADAPKPNTITDTKLKKTPHYLSTLFVQDNAAEAAYILPFKVSEKTFQAAVFEWLSTGDYTPDDILETMLSETKAIFLPMYSFSMDYWGTTTQFYTKLQYHVNHDQAPVYGYAYRPRVRQSISHITGTFYHACLGGNETLKQVLKFIKPVCFNKNELMPFHSRDWQNSHFMGFERTPLQVWLKSVAPYAKAEVYQQKSIPKNCTIEVDFQEKEVFTYFTPYWMFFYQYEGKDYQVFIDGTNAAIVHGDKPEDTERIKQVDAIEFKYRSLGILTLLGIEGFITWSMQTVSAIHIILFVVGLITIFWVADSKSQVIKQKSLQIRQAKLMEKRKATFENNEI